MDKTMFGLIALLFILIGSDIYRTTTSMDKCKDAGGVYVTPSVCINPSAVIEVD